MIPGLDAVESGAISALFGLLIVACVLWALDWTDDDIIGRIRWRIRSARSRARRRRLEAKVEKLTGAGSADLVHAAFPDASAALFDGGSGLSGTGRQVTEWAPYDMRENPGIECPENVADAWIEVRAGAGGMWARWFVGIDVPAGRRVQMPDPGSWFEVV